MLTVRFENDKNALEKIYSRLGVAGDVGGANFILREQKGLSDEGADIGLFKIKMRFENNVASALIDKIAFAQGVHNDDKNFFVRAMLFKLKSGAPVQLVLKGRHEELTIFGFELINGKTVIMSDKIDLHKGCKAE